MASPPQRPYKPKKPATRRRISYAAIPMSGPPVPMHRYDWDHEMMAVDRRIYGLMAKSYPKAFSPEAMQRILKDYALEEIWKSLDSKVMRRYVFRLNQCAWHLLTEGQVREAAKLGQP